MKRSTRHILSAVTALALAGCSSGAPGATVAEDSGAPGSTSTAFDGSALGQGDAGVGAGSGNDGGSRGTPPPEGGTTDATTAGVDAGGDGGATSSGLVLLTEPDDGLSPIYDLINSATHSIDMTMYELEDTTITGLLATAAKNGVVVRVILDQNLEKSSNTAAYDALKSDSVSVHWANPTYSVTHQKTITVDQTRAAIMTLNLTTEYYSTSRDFAVLTSDAADVAAIESTFDDDFTNASVTPPTGDDLVWSPTNAQSSLLGLIDGASTTLLTESEEMSDSAIVSALKAAAARGVAVKVVMTASSSYDSEFTELKNAGVKVVTYAANAALYIHAKVILADYGTSGASAFLGSENYSSTSLTKNRELGLITSDAAVMASLNATLASDFSGATAY